MYISQIQTDCPNNKYTKWYVSIIQRAKSNETCLEAHHIAPKSIYPTWEHDMENLVNLSAKEHYICHLLLTKMFKGQNKYKMYHAFHMMATTKQSDRYLTAFGYSQAKKLNAEASRRNNLGKKKGPKSQETKDKISLALIGKPRKEEDKAKISLTVSGSGNPNAVTIKAISPTGELYQITGGIKSFYQEHKLGLNLVRKCYQQNLQHPTGILEILSQEMDTIQLRQPNEYPSIISRFLVL